MSKGDLFKWIDTNENHLREISQEIWETPELGLNEDTSAKTLIMALDEQNFAVESGVGEMPTAFVASYGEGSPRIGILGEYDALPGLSQEVKAEPDPVEAGAPGHGCGHNLFGTAGVGAAIAVKRAIETGDIEGTIRFYGCPAEETLVGKTYMARDGVFGDLDAAVTWHPSDLSTPRRGSTNALDSLVFTFEGVSAHAAGSPESGRSALDGVELLNTGIEYMREHLSDDARVHYVITEGGQAPNVVPATASVWYFVRAPTRDEVERNTAWLRDIAAGAATMTQTEVEERYLTGCYEYRANETITDVLWKNMQAIAPPEYNEDDYAFARELKATIPEETREAELADIPEQVYETVADETLYPDPIAAFDEDQQSHGSTEVGDVSWITPTGQFRGATWPVGTPSHSWQVVAANGSFGQKGIGFAAKVLAGTTYDLMSNADLLEAVRDEFERTFAGRSYETPLPNDAAPPFDMVTRTD